MAGDTHAVLFGGKIQNAVGSLGQILRKVSAPEFIEIPEGTGRQSGLHLQPVGCHPVKGPQDPVKAGEDPQMFLDIGKLLVREYLRRHIPILQPLVGQDSRRQPLPQVHLPQALHI